MEHLVSPDPAASPWYRVLDDLESSLGALAGGHEPAPWSPPGDIGVIPVELRDRARALLAGQRELAAELQASKNEVARHLSALRSVPAQRQASAAVYLDVLG